jgi:hypothetical protein
LVIRYGKITKLVGADAKVSKHKSTASQVLPKNSDFYFSRIKSGARK